MIICYLADTEVVSGGFSSGCCRAIAKRVSIVFSWLFARNILWSLSWNSITVKKTNPSTNLNSINCSLFPLLLVMVELWYNVCFVCSFKKKNVCLSLEYWNSRYHWDFFHGLFLFIFLSWNINTAVFKSLVHCNIYK